MDQERERLKLLVLGAHPDDADYHAGGLATYYRQAGHDVLLISLTNGDAGHQTLRGQELARRRRAEAAAAGQVIGATYDLYENHDGQLQPTLAVREQVIRLLRSYRPDLVLTHRPNDYHPDHRYTSQLVQDAAYMVTVPAVVPDVPHLAKDPVIAYMPDEFRKPYPFSPTVAIDVGPVYDKIVAMLACHTSQFFEWLPFNTGVLASVPTEPAQRIRWLAEQIRPRLQRQAEKSRALLIERYGPERGQRVELAEAFELCEYGAPLDSAACERLFGFIR